MEDPISQSGSIPQKPLIHHFCRHISGSREQTFFCIFFSRYHLSTTKTPQFTVPFQEYLCTCCLSACSRCTGAYKVQKLDSSNVQAPWHTELWLTFSPWYLMFNAYIYIQLYIYRLHHICLYMCVFVCGYTMYICIYIYIHMMYYMPYGSQYLKRTEPLKHNKHTS